MATRLNLLQLGRRSLEARLGPRARKPGSPGVPGKEDEAVGHNGKFSWRQIGVSALVVLFAVIVLQNTQVVRIQLFFWGLSMSRIILLCFALFVGFAVGYCVTRRERPREDRSHPKRAIPLEEA